MALVTVKYFTEEYGGGAADYISAKKLLERAEGIVMTEIAAADCEPWQEEMLKKAICAEAEFIAANGGVEWINEAGRSYVHLGKFSSTAVGESGGLLSPVAVGYLNRAGLLYRGVKV